jgi:uncharacterized protein YjbI with pentapeptide repeats
MQRAFFRSANLSAGDLESADLSEANLAYARLDRANLKGANLQGAVLDYADFNGAVLMDAYRCRICGRMRFSTVLKRSANQIAN